MIIEKQYLMQLDEEEYDRMLALLWFFGGGAVYPDGASQPEALREAAMGFWNAMQDD